VKSKGGKSKAELETRIAEQIFCIS